MFFNHRLFNHLVIWSGSLLWLLTACQSTNQSSKEQAQSDSSSVVDSATKPTNGPILITLNSAQYQEAEIGLGQVSYRSLHSTLNVNGVLDVPAQNQVSVSVPMGGYIRQIQLEPGMSIQKGKPLVVLENPEYIQVQQDYLDTKAKLTYADLDYARQQELSQENVAALKIFQQTRANRQSLQAQLAGLSQRLTMLHINPAKLTPEQLTRTVTIPAPVSGFVTDVPVNNGRFVNPADVLVQLTDISHLHLRLRIFEKDMASIHSGQRVRFALGDDTTKQVNSYPHRAQIFLIGKSIATDRTVEVLAHPIGNATNFIPGGYISAQIAINTQQLPTLPEASVVNYGGHSFIYALERKPTQTNRSTASYQFRQLEVKTGIREGGYIAVQLPTGFDWQKSQLVIKGAYSLLAKLNNSEEE